VKCEAIRTQLTAYLDGDLEDHRGSAVRGHLRGCEACRQVAADEAALRDGLRSLPPADPPASLWANVQRQLAAAEVADAERPGWRRLLARLAPPAPQIGFAAAIAAAVVLLVIRAQQTDGPGAPSPGVVMTPTPVPPTPVPPVPSDELDVTAELAAAPARTTQHYAQAARELLELAQEARLKWSDDDKQRFDAQLAELRKRVDDATEDRPRQKAYRSLIRYLQRAAIRDEVALASVGGTP
jgi:anti-sigma factor RsiW